MMMFTHAMVMWDGINDHELIEIVFIRNVISVPCDHVEGTVILIDHKQLSLIFTYDLVIDLAIFVPSHRRLKVSWICQTVRSWMLAPLINSLIKKNINLLNLLNRKNSIVIFQRWHNSTTLFFNKLCFKNKIQRIESSINVEKIGKFGLIFSSFWRSIK